MAVEAGLSNIVSAIRNKQVVVMKGSGHLQLPPGLKWPAADSELLFVRSCYAPLFEKVLHKCGRTKAALTSAATAQEAADSAAADDSPERIILTGQPGIGKSVWG